jgi:hypothetical protein
MLYRSGVEFFELSDCVRNAITEFVDGLRTGRMS